MLKMSSSILDKLELIMKVLPELIIDTISKSFIIFKVFLKKILQFDLRHLGFDLKIMFIMMPTLYNSSIN